MIIGIDKKELQKQREQKYNEYAILLNSEKALKYGRFLLLWSLKRCFTKFYIYKT